MRIRTPQQKPKILLLALVGVILLGLIGVAWFYHTHRSSPPSKAPSQGAPSRDVNNVNYSPPSPQQQNPAVDPEPPKPTPNSNLSVTITSANQTSDSLVVRALISPLVNGTCTLALSRAGTTTVTLSAPIQPLASASTCQGFNVSSSTLTPGTWSLEITATSTTGLSGNATHEVVIR